MDFETALKALICACLEKGDKLERIGQVLQERAALLNSVHELKDYFDAESKAFVLGNRLE